MVHGGLTGVFLDGRLGCKGLDRKLLDMDNGKGYNIHFRVVVGV